MLQKGLPWPSFTIVAALLALPTASLAEPVAPAVHKLAVLDSMEVENHWPAGVHFHWESGDPDGHTRTTNRS